MFQIVQRQQYLTYLIQSFVRYMTVAPHYDFSSIVGYTQASKEPRPGTIIVCSPYLFRPETV